MLAKVAEAIPDAEGFLFEPKWDGFRAIVFRGRETDQACLVSARDVPREIEPRRRRRVDIELHHDCVVGHDGSPWLGRAVAVRGFDLLAICIAV